MRKLTGFAGGIVLLSFAVPAVAQSYGPPAPAARAAAAAPVLRTTQSAAVSPKARAPFLGASSRTGDVQLGLGLFRVPKSNDNDPNRNFPMRDTNGRTQRVAALGASFRF